MTSPIHYAKGPKGRIAYQVIGDGPIDLVFCRDPTFSLEIMWEEPNLTRFLRNLAEFSRLICFDWLGYGVSDSMPPEYPQTASAMSYTIDAAMRGAGSQRAAILGAGSVGPAAICQATNDPARTASLILCNTWPCLSRQPDYPCGMPRPAFDRMMDRLEEGWGTDENVPIVAPSLAGNANFRSTYARLQRTGVPLPAMRTWFRAHYAEDLRSLLPGIGVPTLVTHFAGDRFARVCHGRYLGEHIPHAKYVELEGDDHYFFFTEKADAVVHEVQKFLTGTTTVTDTERVLVTVLFVDVVGSTQRIAEIGDRGWRDLLEAFYRTVRQGLGSFRGQEHDAAGDGILASFDAPTRAIRCAASLSRDLTALGLPIRAGLHTGECERDGASLRGMAVHIGVRVAAQARPGEVLVSSTVREAVTGSALRFAERGTHALKGVPGEWRLYAVDG